MIEIFKDIKGYEGYYQVSNLGRIKSIDRYVKYNDRPPVFVSGKIKTLSLKTNGYLSVMLTKDRVHKRYYIHRIVYQNFNDNINEKHEINHIDGNKLNNKIENLEAITHRENILHAIKIGLIKRKHEKRCI